MQLNDIKKDQDFVDRLRLTVKTRSHGDNNDNVRSFFVNQCYCEMGSAAPNCEKKNYREI